MIGDSVGAHKDEVHVVAHNPQSSSRSWADNKRLEQLRVEYRVIGTATWLPALNASGAPLFLRAGPNDDVSKSLMIMIKTLMFRILYCLVLNILFSFFL